MDHFRRKRLSFILVMISLLLCSCSSSETSQATRTSRETKQTTATFRQTVSSTSAPSTSYDPSSPPADLIRMEDIADLDWAKKQAPHFVVTTPEEFAGAVVYLNTYGSQDFPTITLQADLDLDAYDWAPIEDFSGNINGGGHTIRNIHLVTRNRQHNGIIGVNGGAIGVFDLNVLDATVYGGKFAGIIVGEGYMLNFVNVYASGEVYSDGEYVGALIGRTSPKMTYDTCSMDVMINGKRAEFLSYTQENEARAFQFEDEIYILTLRDDHTVVRTSVDRRSHNLTWRIIYNDEIVLERGADDELEYRYSSTKPGKYKIYLTEFNSEFDGYVRVSNIVEYTI